MTTTKNHDGTRHAADPSAYDGQQAGHSVPFAGIDLALWTRLIAAALLIAAVVTIVLVV
jgi:hypothetical protein